jgi:hypothetical protein
MKNTIIAVLSLVLIGCSNEPDILVEIVEQSDSKISFTVPGGTGTYTKDAYIMDDMNVVISNEDMRIVFTKVNGSWVGCDFQNLVTRRHYGLLLTPRPGQENQYIGEIIE